MDIALNHLRKAALYTAGVISFVVGIAGVILPGLPGTPFFLLSALCFKLACDD